MSLFIPQKLLIAPILKTFFKNLKLPTLTPDDAASLEGEISKEEISGAIKAMRSNKAQEPDVFEFKKKKKTAK